MVKISQDKNNKLLQDFVRNILQIRSISTQRFIKKIGIISSDVMSDILASLMISVDYF
ncbi:hypothetical protein GM3708_117 [Geminocystis sp. NIES-3708]|uniref:type II toxin-antitoxin system PemK/MazF family toxin n=1 Tax=Geminocystis sp. NIES-3708 TaxID=1615909 RepID=UPI0005FCD541|nr:type II toxin-antitoxin system PemK/MazF family toxin [Geminocystis sp. NIES-3708]BAQ59712.1 hypothetical protein GM3708_117 [Geminocystis sp. NIES-3708]